MGSDSRPKCLLPIQGKSLLQITLDAMRAAGIGHVVLVVGYKKEEVIAEAAAHAGSIRLTIVENPRYSEGAILSLWTARDYLEGDLLIMDADVLFPQIFLERLVRSPHSNCLLVDGSAADTGEEQIVLGEGTRVLFITKRPSAGLRSKMTVFGESIGFLKLSREGAALLKSLLDAKVQAGIVNIEHEQVYPDLFSQVIVGFERVDGLLPWTEIDTPDDLRRAEKEIYPRWSASRGINRVISSWFLPFIARLPVTPNQWTFLSFLSGIVGLIYLTGGNYFDGLLGAFFFQLFYLVDNWDGEVARLKGLSSWWGGWFDVAVDAVIQTALPLCIALGIQNNDGPDWVMPMGWMASSGTLLDFLVTGFAKRRGFGPGIFGDSTQRESNSRSWLQVNFTHENFSMVVVAVMLLNLRIFFLAAMAVGTQLFWIHYLWRERKRFFYSFAQARR